MSDLRKKCGLLTADALKKFAIEKNIELVVEASDLILETPPNPDMGDVGIPMFSFAKIFKTSPTVIAKTVVKYIDKNQKVGDFSAVGPYVNIKFAKETAINTVLEKIINEGAYYGQKTIDGSAALEGRRVMIEFSSPNTNKPLHLGHLRNDALGESCARILKNQGADVYKVNNINDRGVHICKSMLAYQLFHEKNNDTPESLGIKSDRFVGDCYVAFDTYAKEHPEAEKTVQEMLLAWENGDEKVHALWKKMNTWAIDGVQKTYERTGISFDKIYYESETYLKGKEIILKGLHDDVFYTETDGSVWIDLSEINLDKKVLLRKDGTALYMTQDIGLAVARHRDWDFNQLIYVVGSEQIYHFKVLFYILKKLGYDWAQRLYHLSYGMVNLPEGKMKSREGTVVDADDLIDELRDGALEEITSKGREKEVENAQTVAEKVALGALHYFLLQTTPSKDMIFNPKESLSFNGNTGPYIQYMGARISSIIKKAHVDAIKSARDIPENDRKTAVSLLTNKTEWELIKLLSDFQKVLSRAAENLDPSAIANYLYDVAKTFSRFYHDCPILSAHDAFLISARLELAQCTLTVLQNGMDLILIPFLETM
ncbi:MAG TPA: arginine--tRNA ligase [Treponemataceae bacterium]|nr:arginine--tRNA ligase [Treponemataceae bacterium]